MNLCLYKFHKTLGSKWAQAPRYTCTWMSRIRKMPTLGNKTGSCLRQYRSLWSQRTDSWFRRHLQDIRTSTNLINNVLIEFTRWHVLLLGSIRLPEPSWTYVPPFWHGLVLFETTFSHLEPVYWGRHWHSAEPAEFTRHRPLLRHAFTVQIFES